MGNPRTLGMLPNIDTAAHVTAIMNLNFDQPFVPQVQAYFKSLGDARGFARVALVGQGVGAILTLPALEMLGGLPEVALIPFKSREIAGWLDTRNFRHEICRNMRNLEDAGKNAPVGYTVIDGAGRGLTTDQLSQLATQLKCEVSDIRVFSTNPGQVDFAKMNGEEGLRLAEGIKAAMVQAEFPVNETIDTNRLLFVPHGAGIVATVQALALHGFTGSWPRTVRLSGTPAEGFKVAEIIDPQAMRQWAMGLSAQLDTALPTVVLSGVIPDGFRAALELLANEHGVTIRG